MRKVLLLATTAVVGAGMLIGTASAQMQTAPEVVAPRSMGSAAAGVNIRLGGFFNFQGAWINDSADKQAVALSGGRRAGRRQHNFIQETEIYVFADGKTASGMTYGFEVQFQIDGLQNAPGNTAGLGNGTGFNTDEAFGYIAGTWGTFKFGDEDSAASLLQVRRPGITGLDSDSYWDEQLVNGSPSIFTGINDGSDATKIIYLSPQFFGFDFGASYSPSSTEGDRAAQSGYNSGARDRSTIQDEVSVAARFRTSIAGVGIAAGVGAQTAGAPQTTTTGVANFQQVTAYTAGLTATAYGFTVGGEYTWGQYTGVSVGRAALGTGRRNSEHLVASLAYVVPGVGLQVGGFYGRGTQDINGTNVGGLAGGARAVGGPEFRQSVWGVGLAYPLAPGLVAFTSYTKVNEKNSPYPLTAGQPRFSTGREVDVALAGLRLAF